jgi:hypothetical protein
VHSNPELAELFNLKALVTDEGYIEKFNEIYDRVTVELSFIELVGLKGRGFGLDSVGLSCIELAGLNGGGFGLVSVVLNCIELVGLKGEALALSLLKDQSGKY